MDSVQKLIGKVLLMPVFIAMLAAIYAYFEFSSDGIIQPDLGVATFIVALLTFGMAYTVAMSIYYWRLLR
jgi:hypothetical protein